MVILILNFEDPSDHRIWQYHILAVGFEFVTNPVKLGDDFFNLYVGWISARWRVQMLDIEVMNGNWCGLQYYGAQNYPSIRRDYDDDDDDDDGQRIN